MKPLIAFLLAFTAFPLFVKTQSTFPTANAEWTSCAGFGVLGGTNFYFYHRNYLDGDTVVNGMTYAKVYHQNVCSTDNQPPPGVAVDGATALVAGLRSEGPKVYAVRFDFPQAINDDWWYDIVDLIPLGEERLLYDFSLSLNDTIDWLLGHSGTPFRVTSVTQVQGRKVFKLLRVPSGPPEVVWHEGLGAVGGLFYTGAGNTWFHFCGGRITVDDTIRVDGPYPCPDVPPVILTPVFEPTATGGYRLFPNPAAEGITVEAMEGEHPFRVAVYSLQGQLIALKENAVGSVFLDINRLASGPFLIKIQEDHRAPLWQRVIKR